MNPQTVWAIMSDNDVLEVVCDSEDVAEKWRGHLGGRIIEIELTTGGPS